MQNVRLVTMLSILILTILPRPLVMTDLQPTASVGTEVAYGVVGRMDVVTLDAIAQATVEERVKILLRAPASYGRMGSARWGGLGNVSGGAWLLHQHSNLRLGAGATLWLPTASHDASVAQLMRMAHEPGEFIPGATTLRVEALVRVEGGPAFAQVEAAFMEIWLREGPDYNAEISRGGIALGMSLGRGWAVWTTIADVLVDLQGIF